MCIPFKMMNCAACGEPGSEQRVADAAVGAAAVRLAAALEAPARGPEHGGDRRYYGAISMEESGFPTGGSGFPIEESSLYNKTQVSVVFVPWVVRL